MKSLFDGLDEFGIDAMESLDLFATEEEKKKADEMKTSEKKPEDYLYDRTVRCPVCNSKIVARTVKSGAAKLVETSLNLRPIYSGIDPIIYDVVSCEICGYSALNRNFNKLTDRQSKLIKEKISMKFVGTKYPPVYDYKIALTRYKMALYNDVIIERNDVNKAYLCLKISWLIESLLIESKNTKEQESLKKEYKAFVTNAYKGFITAYDSVSFPVFGMNQPTYHYLLGVLSYELGDLKNTGYWLGKVMLLTSGNTRLKEKARALKDKIDNEKHLKQESS